MKYSGAFLSIILLSSVPLISSSLAEPSKILSPRQQMVNGILPENVVCQDSFVLIKKLSQNSVACVKPQTAEKLVARGWGMINTLFQATNSSLSSMRMMIVTNTKLSVNYTISNAKLISVQADAQSLSVTVTLQTNGDGNLIITIPRTLVEDPRISHQQDVQPSVLGDGQVIDYKEIKTTSTNRTLSIPFKNGINQIEIIGTHVT